MEALRQTWSAMPAQSRILALGAAVIALAAVLWIAAGAASPRLSLLYGGLDARAAAEVVTALDAMGVESDIRGDAIFVPTEERDRIRIALAGQGLPREGQDGYELLDQMSGFGTTAEMFRTQVLRARQGELERTIVSMPGVSGARVHIAQPDRRAFGRDDEPVTASVTITSTGGPLSESAAMSIRYLVALAVADLSPEQVGVIDTRHGVILAPGDDMAGGGTDAEDRQAERLRAEISMLLAARLGPDAFRVSVTVETSRLRQTLSERIVDPDSQAPVRSERVEITDESTGAGGQVTVGGQLPEGDAGAAGGDESSRSESRETVQFLYSETLRDVVTEPGAVLRLGVAVLIDDVAIRAEDGSVTFEARTADEIAAIEELVKSAIAFDPERGDIVTVESMRFAEDEEIAPVEPISGFDLFIRENGELLVQLGALVLVSLVLGLFVVRPILMRDAEPLPEFPGSPALPGVGSDAATIGSDGQPVVTMEAAQVPQTITIIDPNTGQPTIVAAPAPQVVDPAALAAAEAARATVEQSLAASDAPSADIGSLESAAIELGQQAIDAEHARPRLEVLRQEVAEKQDQSVALLKRWLNLPHDKSHSEVEAEVEERQALKAAGRA